LLGRHGEGGQSAIVMVAVLFMFTVFGFAVIDAGLAYAARRDAQSDADLIALAGAIELPDFDNDAAGAIAAEAAADLWADGNNVASSELTLTVIRDCFSADDGYYTGVQARVERTAPGFFFGTFPGVPQLTVSATATACSGAPQSASGFLPWAVETAGNCFTNEPNPADRTPILGERCDLVVGGAAGETGDIGQLALSTNPNDNCEDGNGSANVYETNIIGGGVITCEVGDSVASNTGANVGKTKSGLATRLANDGLCGTTAIPNFAAVQSQTNTFNAHPTITDLFAPDVGGVDDFFEIWRPSLNYDPSNPGDNLEQHDCDLTTGAKETSPRNVTVVIITDIAIDDGGGCTGGGGTSPHCYLVLGFARMYIEGCTTAAQGFAADCAQPGGGGSFTIHARFINAVGSTSAALGINQFGEIQTVLQN
jgi:hypothetical protein